MMRTLTAVMGLWETVMTREWKQHDMLFTQQYPMSSTTECEDHHGIFWSTV